MFMQPMLLEKRDQPFDDDRYIFEPKIDGHRLILSKIKGQVRLYTRHNNDCTRQYPELWNVPLDGDVILDGEVACIHPQTGFIDFESVMERFRMTKQARIKEAIARQPINFIVFDILQHNGQDLRNKPLFERKEILSRLLTQNDYYTNITHIEDNGTALFDLIQQRSMEGIVAKRKDSLYAGRRSEAWLKIVNYRYADVYISGYRKDQFGWLAQIDGRPAGIIELAVPIAHKKAFYGVAQALVIGEDRNFVYMDPRIKAKVKFRNWTKNGMLRTPAFVDFVL